jgi:hypothetical protein
MKYWNKMKVVALLGSGLLASVIGGWNAEVQLRDGTTGALLDTLEIENRHTFVGRLVFAPAGDVLAVGLSDRVQLWDVTSGTRITGNHRLVGLPAHRLCAGWPHAGAGWCDERWQAGAGNL